MASTFSFHFRNELHGDQWEDARGFLVSEFDYLYAALASLSPGAAVTPSPPSTSIPQHHLTHETGGSDAITNLSAGILTSGTLLDVRLSPNVPLLNSPNQFTISQEIRRATNPALFLNETGQPANGRLWELTSSGGLFTIWPLDDTYSTIPGVVSVTVSRVGDLTMGRALTLKGAPPAITLTDTSQGIDLRIFSVVNSSATFTVNAYNDALTSILSTPLLLTRAGDVRVGRLLQIGGGGTANPGLGVGGGVGEYSTALQVGTADNSNWATVRAGNFVSSGGGNNLADLTCGTTNFTNGIYVSSGNIVGAGYLQIIGAVYPGRVDTTAQQGSWYLASHGSYGLYTNTGLYFATGAITSGAVAAGQIFVQMQAGAIAIGVNGTAAANEAIFYNANGAMGAIQVSGTTCSYLNLSDARMKRDLGIVRETTVLRDTVIHDYEWITDGQRARGVFSQDAYTVLPAANAPGTDEYDEDGHLVHPWMTDYSKYVPDLIVGWQQHAADIAALRAELAALKGRS